MDVIVYALVSFSLVVIGTIIVVYLQAKRYDKTGEVAFNPKKRWPEIVEVKYMGPVSTEVKRGGFMGALVGNFLLGDLGLVVGGLAPRGSKTLYRFAVKYDNGKVKIEDCYNNDGRYQELMRFVNWDDL